MLLSLLRLPYSVVKIRDMMAGLVPMNGSVTVLTFPKELIEI